MKSSVTHEIDTNGCNNDNDKLSNNVTVNISSLQVNLRNNIKKHQHEHKTRQKKKWKGLCSVTVVVGDSIVKKLKVGSYPPKMIYLF